jgi:hypothetical protein
MLQYLKRDPAGPDFHYDHRRLSRQNKTKPALCTTLYAFSACGNLDQGFRTKRPGKLLMKVHYTYNYTRQQWRQDYRDYRRLLITVKSMEHHLPCCVLIGLCMSHARWQWRPSVAECCRRLSGWSSVEGGEKENKHIVIVKSSFNRDETQTLAMEQMFLMLNDLQRCQRSLRSGLC